MNFAEKLSKLYNYVYISAPWALGEIEKFNEFKPNIYNYSFQELPKPKGGYRQIDIPNDNYKDLQSFILELLSDYKWNSCVYGLGGTERNAQSNASKHLGAKVVIKMDIEKFYPSTNAHKFLSIIEKRPQSEYVFLKHIIPFVFIFHASCLKFKKSDFYRMSYLPTGAPTSSFISSMAFLNIDEKLDLLSKEHNLIYTRYIDDLTFSGEKYPVRFQAFVNQTIKDGGYKLNHKKSQILYQSNHTQNVTGVALNTGESRVTRQYRRELRTELDQKAKNGQPLDDIIKCKLAYVHQVNLSQYIQLIKYYTKRQIKWNLEKNIIN